MSILFLQFILGIDFLTLVFLHLTKKNFSAIVAYAIQSLVIATVLFNSFWESKNIYLLFVVLLVVVIKIILAPMFFNRLIKKHALAFSASTYLNAPLTLIVIAILTFVAQSKKLAPLTSIVPGNKIVLVIVLSTIFISLFLIVNRKGALSQIIGVLSLENNIVAFVAFAGLEQSPGLQAGVIFDMTIWIIISTVFASMIYEHFGSHDVTAMKKLKD